MAKSGCGCQKTKIIGFLVSAKIGSLMNAQFVAISKKLN